MKEDIKTATIVALCFLFGISFFWSLLWTGMATDLRDKSIMQEQELKLVKEQLYDMTIERNNYQALADEWFVNYIELGLQCGANE